MDLSKVMPIARCGYYQYAVVRETFVMMPPGDGKMAIGLEGSVVGNTRAWQETRESKIAHTENNYDNNA